MRRLRLMRPAVRGNSRRWHDHSCIFTANKPAQPLKVATCCTAMPPCSAEQTCSHQRTAADANLSRDAACTPATLRIQDSLMCFPSTRPCIPALLAQVQQHRNNSKTEQDSSFCLLTCGGTGPDPAAFTQHFRQGGTVGTPPAPSKQHRQSPLGNPTSTAQTAPVDPSAAHPAWPSLQTHKDGEAAAGTGSWPHTWWGQPAKHTRKARRMKPSFECVCGAVDA
jgi:hypothetical protein